MADLIESIPAVRIPNTPLVAVAPKPAASEGAADDVVILTPGQLKTDSTLKERQARLELTEAASLERQAGVQQTEAEMHKRESSNDDFAAAKADRSAGDAQDEAAEAAAEGRRAEEAAQETRWEADRKEALSCQKKQEAELLKVRAEGLLDDSDVENFNEGVFLLGLSDSGFQAADSLHEESVHLASNVQASLDLAQSCRTRATQKSDEARQQKTTADKGHADAKEEIELSARAREAAEALNLDAGERRKAAEKLLAEAGAESELAELGHKVQGGFLVV